MIGGQEKVIKVEEKPKYEERGVGRKVSVIKEDIRLTKEIKGTERLRVM